MYCRSWSLSHGLCLSFMWILYLTIRSACRSLQPCVTKPFPDLWMLRWTQSLRRTWLRSCRRSDLSTRPSLKKTAVTWRAGTRSRWDHIINSRFNASYVQIQYVLYWYSVINKFEIAFWALISDFVTSSLMSWTSRWRQAQRPSRPPDLRSAS